MTEIIIIGEEEEEEEEKELKFVGYILKPGSTSTRWVKANKNSICLPGGTV